jgi:uncharacterized protein YbjQ (UPF0145 family)
MLISTMNDLPGYEVTEVLGEVFGLTVRSRNVGSQIGASFKSLAGGELKGMTKNLIASRQEVTERMVQEAEAKGADVIWPCGSTPPRWGATGPRSAPTARR